MASNRDSEKIAVAGRSSGGVPPTKAGYISCDQGIAHQRTKRCSEREPAVSLGDKHHLIGRWLPSLTFPLGRLATMRFKELHWSQRLAYSIVAIAFLTTPIHFVLPRGQFHALPLIACLVLLLVCMVLGFQTQLVRCDRHCLHFLPCGFI